MNDDTQYRLHVMESLGELKTDMKSLVGNGQPGRIDKLEAKVERHSWYIALGVGAVALLSYILQYAVSLLPTMVGSGK